MSYLRFSLCITPCSVHTNVHKIHYDDVKTNSYTSGTQDIHGRDSGDQPVIHIVNQT